MAVPPVLQEVGVRACLSWPREFLVALVAASLDTLSSRELRRGRLCESLLSAAMSILQSRLDAELLHSSPSMRGMVYSHLSGGSCRVV